MNPLFVNCSWISIFQIACYDLKVVSTGDIENMCKIMKTQICRCNHRYLESPLIWDCQYTKYQPVTGILNSLGPGVKVSFTILHSSVVSKPSNSRSSHCSGKTMVAWSKPIILISAKNDKLENVSMSLISLKNLWIAEQYWKRVHLKTDSSGLKFLVQYRLTKPQGELTLTMSANQAVRKDLLHFLDIVKKAA